MTKWPDFFVQFYNDFLPFQFWNWSCWANFMCCHRREDYEEIVNEDEEVLNEEV